MVVKTKEEIIAAKIRDKFEEEYPSINQKFKDYILPFVSWVVDATMKEIKK